jgi:hypothetical protein
MSAELRDQLGGAVDRIDGEAKVTGPPAMHPTSK